MSASLFNDFPGTVRKARMMSFAIPPSPLRNTFSYRKTTTLNRLTFYTRGSHTFQSHVNEFILIWTKQVCKLNKINLTSHLLIL